jgi:hypothetical protein
MTNQPSTGPNPRGAISRQLEQYLTATSWAAALAVFLYLVGLPGLALEVSVGVLLVLVLQQLGKEMMLRLFGSGIDPTSIGVTGPFAGAIASWSSLGLYAVTGRDSLLVIALTGLCANALGMLPVMPRERPAGYFRLVPGLVSVVGACAVLGTPWGFAALLFVVVQLMIQPLEDVGNPSDRARYSPTGLSASLVTWLVITTGLAICIASINNAV